jgi:hypothetical protein
MERERHRQDTALPEKAQRRQTVGSSAV